ncbi:MAG: S1 RNA-binding domain-containing protein, partial [FCB group bacterium]|nr:S1 RNA-binding domain-containing protein [FCB group bacterium]
TNPWEKLASKYKPGKMVKAKVLKILDKGIIMTLDEEEVEAIVPLGSMSKKDKRDFTHDIKVGDELELRVVEVRQDERKVVLAGEDLGLSEDDKDIARVMAKQEEVTQKIEIPEEVLLKLKKKDEKPEAAKKTVKKAEKAEEDKPEKASEKEEPVEEEPAEKVPVKKATKKAASKKEAPEAEESEGAPVEEEKA